MPTYRLYASMGTEVSVLRAGSQHNDRVVYDQEMAGQAPNHVANHSDYMIGKSILPPSNPLRGS